MIYRIKKVEYLTVYNSNAAQVSTDTVGAVISFVVLMCISTASLDSYLGAGTVAALYMFTAVIFKSNKPQLKPF